jgi:hypothetical protein
MSPLNRKLSPVVNGRLAAYATLAGAALAVPALAPSADATIVYSGTVNINVPSTTAGVYLNVVTGIFGATQASSPGWDVNPWLSSGLNLFGSTTATGNEGPSGLNGIGAYAGTGTTFFNLAFMAPINGSTTYAGTGNTTPAGATPLNLNSSNNLFGFRFVDATTNGGAVCYGWIRVSLSATSGSQPRAIVEYAYDNAGGSIGAGQVPEPSTVALLGVMAAGAVGIRAWRKRKAA